MNKKPIYTDNEVPNFYDLIFPVQNIANENISRSFSLIKEIDKSIENGTCFTHKLKIPFSSIYKLTILYGRWICNFTCPNYCYTKNQNSKKLDTQFIKKIITYFYNNGCLYTYWPGVGEITLIPDFWDIMKFQNTINMDAVVFTNGSVFIDEDLCHATLKGSTKEFLNRITEYKNTHFYIKLWSTNARKAAQMVGVSAETKYPYESYLGLNVPKAFKELHRRFGKRVGLQVMVTKENYQSYQNEILPFCRENKISLFAEPTIFSGNAKYSSFARNNALSDDERIKVEKTFASGGIACSRRQFGEIIINGDRLVPGIAIPSRDLDSIETAKNDLRIIDQIFFNEYFRSQRKYAEKNNGCLCRKYNS
jgi:hypothetical protein